MTSKLKAIKAMQKKTGATIGELVAKGINKNSARRIVSDEFKKIVMRKCRMTGKVVSAYCI